MTCDLTPVFALLTAAAISIAIAIGFIIAAAAANNSFFGASGSPGLMVAAGVAALAAVGSLAGTRAMVESYFVCMGSPEQCIGAFNNLLNAITGLMTVLSIQSTASFAAAGIAWIPWVGAAPMYVILGALIIQAALIPTVTVFVNDLITCVQEAAIDPISSAAAPLVATVVEVLLIASLAYTFRASKQQ
jgi:hypothetical protein